MAGDPVKIGPFVGGMNTYSGVSAIADNEAVEILNMDVDLDGSLVGRPGINQYGTAPLSGTSHIIGQYTSVTGIFYAIYAFANSVRALNTSDKTWSTIQAGVFTDCVQYNNKLWLVQMPSGTTQGGGSWDPVAGWTAVPTMPRGYSACIYKERMFIAASVNSDTTSVNRVKFSNPANPGTWTSTDTFDVNAGDGQDIMCLYVFDSSIIIFKTDSTYIYAYESQPTKGQVQAVSQTIGANNNFCTVEYENSLFVMHEDKVYRISNWQWEHANIKLPFQYRNTAISGQADGTSLAAVGNRIVARYYDYYYCLGTKTGAWTTWIFGDGTSMFPTDFIRDPNIDPAAGTARYFAANHVGGTTNWYIFVDAVNSVARSETFTIRLISKAYDYGVPYGFKRLYWWGADIFSKSEIQYRVSPIAFNIPITWGQLALHPFSEYLTWGRPLDISIDVSDSAGGSNPSNFRTFIKLLKGLRFRQLQFTLVTQSDGSTVTGPLRIFSLTSFVDNKELVSKKVS
jgi:hypothetical protein